jgi:hypothetical protein
VEEARRFGPEHLEHLFSTGPLERDTSQGHELQMYRWSEIAALCSAHGTITEAAASNSLTAGIDPATTSWTAEEWERLLDIELRLCREPGVLDGGTHVVVALRAPDES